MITASAWIAILVAQGFGPAQADAIARYSAIEASPNRGAFQLDMPLDECANSIYGEGLLGVTRGLRGELHRFGFAVRGAQCPNAGSRVPAETQAAFLAYAFPLHYPNCAARFKAGDLTAFKRCWGQGRGN